MSSSGNLGGVGARRTKNVVSDADYAAMREHYSFVPPEPDTASKEHDNSSVSIDGDDNKARSQHGAGVSSWQGRMVAKYHEHLFKEFALADLSVAGRIGLRWRTREEVIIGRGERTCGNKRCTSNIDDLVTLEVPFSYEEHGERKKELVKLRLCVKCRPLLPYSTANKPSTTKTITSTENKSEQDADSCGDSQDSIKKKKRKRMRSKQSHRKEKKRRRRNTT